MRWGRRVEHVAQAGVRIDAEAAAVFHQRVKDGSALAGVSFADEERGLLANGRGPDRVFTQVVADLDPAVFALAFERGPLFERVGDGSAEQALRKVPPLLRP